MYYVFICKLRLYVNLKYILKYGNTWNVSCTFIPLIENLQNMINFVGCVRI